MDAILLQDIYASQLGALPWNLDDYLIAPQGAVVAVEALDDRGIHCAVILDGHTVGLTLPLNAVEQIEEPDLLGWRISEPELPEMNPATGRYTG